MKKITIIGGGLAGVEAAYQCLKRGLAVDLYEMRPHKMTPAHKTVQLAELVCSNSFRSKLSHNAPGLLKEEMAMLDSLVVEAAKASKIPAGGALAVDREMFSKYVENKLQAFDGFKLIRQEVKQLPKGPTIIATGPLTSEALFEHIMNFLADDALHFFDAVAPIISKESIDMNVCYYKNRYDDEIGKGDYINCPMDEDEYHDFYETLTNSDVAQIKAFEENVFEGCMPIETMAKRGKDTLRYGPMKPVGLRKHVDHKPYAVVQLRKDDARDQMYNIVGFQTHLTFPAQKELIKKIPGLNNAEIMRYGVMHKNVFLKSPNHLYKTYQSKAREDLFFAGQITGVEGYIESAGSGLIAGINIARYVQEKPLLSFPTTTILGASSDYLEHASVEQFQPMNANFGLVDPIRGKHRKKERKALYAKRALKDLKAYMEAQDERF